MSAPVPPTAPYGPQTLAIRRFLQRLAALRPADWTAATTAFDALQGDRRFLAADRALSDAVSRTQRETERDAALGPLAQLLRTPEAAPSAAPGEEPPLAPVAEAALAAILALLVRDVLPASAFATLYAPFATLIPVDALGGTGGPAA
ncbi:MAG: hypothetical protein ACXW05_00845 [Gemmatirosa sp.]